MAGYGGPNAGCSGRCTSAGAWQRVCGKYWNITIALLYWLAAVNNYRCNYTCHLWHYDCLSGTTKQAMLTLNVLSLSPACPYDNSSIEMKVSMQRCCGIILRSANPKYCEKSLYQCQFGHHKYQMEGPGIEPRPPGVRGRKLNA